MDVNAVDMTDFKSTNGIGEMATMDRTGDTKVIWDSKNADEVENAQKQFDTLVKVKKFAAFAVNKDGTKSEQIRAFDATLEKIIFVPPLAGG